MIMVMVMNMKTTIGLQVIRFYFVVESFNFFSFFFSFVVFIKFYFIFKFSFMKRSGKYL